MIKTIVTNKSFSFFTFFWSVVLVISIFYTLINISCLCLKKIDLHRSKSIVNSQLDIEESKSNDLFVSFVDNEKNNLNYVHEKYKSNRFGITNNEIRFFCCSLFLMITSFVLGILSIFRNKKSQ
jgi:hypothetical protein